MIETMHDCYLSQFNCMKKILADRNEIVKDFSSLFMAAKPDRIYLIGSGSSYNACTCASFFIEKTLQIEVTVAAPTCMGKIYGNHPLVIAVSQSGRSTNTINAIKRAREAGATVVTLTDPTDTPVGNIGDLALHIAADNEQIGPRTRGYTATILTLYLMALEAGLACGAIDSTYHDMAIAGYSATFDKGETYFEACQKFYDAHFDDLSKVRKYVFTGKGALAGTGEECALKVLETLCYPAFGYEYEEFLHGPVCFADEELALFIFLSEDRDIDRDRDMDRDRNRDMNMDRDRNRDRERMLQTAGIIDKITRNCYIVAHDPGIFNHEPAVKSENVLLLPSASPEFSSVFTHVLFGQLISAKLTEDLARARHPGVKEIFSSMDTKAPIEQS